MGRVGKQVVPGLAGAVVAVLAGVLSLCALATPAYAQRWTWHASAGIGPRQQGLGAVLVVWAGVPSVNQLFVRAGAGTGGPGQATTTLEAGAVYFVPLSRLSPELAARYPALDPFVGAAVTFGNESNVYATAGATYSLGERSWFWGELRVGGPPAVVVGLGLTL